MTSFRLQIARVICWDRAVCDLSKVVVARNILAELNECNINYLMDNVKFRKAR